MAMGLSPSLLPPSLLRYLVQWVLYWSSGGAGGEGENKKQLQVPTCLKMLQVTFSLDSCNAHYIKAMKSLPSEKPI